MVISLPASSPPASDDGSYAGLAEDFDHGMCAIGAEIAGMGKACALASPVAASLDLRCRRSGSGEWIASARLTFTGDGVGADAVAVDSEVAVRGLERSALNAASPAVSGSAITLPARGFGKINVEGVGVA